MKLFISNVSFFASDQDLGDLFSDCGFRLDSLVMPINSATGNPRGFAFAEIRDDELALRAIAEIDGKELKGRNINVQRARENPRDHVRQGGRSARASG